MPGFITFMARYVVKRVLPVVCLFLAGTHGSFGGGPSIRKTDVWATAYYAGWMQGWSNNGHLRAGDIDYSAVTHIIHFALVPRPDGTFDWNANSITETNSAALVARARTAGKKVLIAVGGWGSDVAFRRATDAHNRRAFVSNLVRFVDTRGYDGVDLDWEVLEASDASQYIAFVVALRSALNELKPPRLLTAAVSWQPDVFGKVHQYFDQINVMTYDMAGAWSDWVTWHNAPVYDGGATFPTTGKPLPSAHGQINSFIAAGVPPDKLGIGIDFYGYVWSGGAGTSTGGSVEPRQKWTLPPSVQSNVPYFTIMRDYYRPEFYQWDTSAHAAYLRIDNPGAVADKFVTYDNEASIRKKFEYARSSKLGGVFIWELGAGYRPELGARRRDPLLQAVKTALSISLGSRGE
jgi:chitinase